MRKSFLLLLCVWGINAAAQKGYSVIPYYGNDTLNNYITGIMHKTYAERSKKVALAIKSAGTIKSYGKEVKEKYLGLLPFMPLDIQKMIPSKVHVGTINEENYNIERVIINKTITTNVYVPKTAKKKKTPAILFLCGHEMEGKATESYQKTAILLAENGFVVMVVDHISQGERVQFLDTKNKSVTGKATSEHTILNMGATLYGWSIVQEELVDNTMCLNYLISRPEVNKKKIGVMGNSGGGAQATYLAAYDNRIKAIATCSWFTKRERMLDLNGPDDACQHLWGETRQQLEIADYYLMNAPRPTLILAGKKDFIDYQGTEAAFEELKQAYTKLKKPANAELFTVDDEHGISKPKREKAANFFRQQFFKDKIPEIITEKEIKIHTEEQLRCTQSGQVQNDDSSIETFQERNSRMISQYSDKRDMFKNRSARENQAMIRRVYSIPTLLPTVKTELVKIDTVNYMLREKYLVHRPGEMPLPVVLLTSTIRETSNEDVILVLDDGGKEMAVRTFSVDSMVNAAGNQILLIDPRGIGETTDKESRNNPKFYSDNYRTAANALLNGRPILGQRIVDIITAIDFAQTSKALMGKRLRAVSNGNIGVALLHAAYLDSRIIKATTFNCISSWEKIARDPLTPNRMDLIVPGVMLLYDIPYLKSKTPYDE